MGALFGTSAPTLSDVILLVELAIASLLLVGTFLVRAGNVRWHKYLQSSMVLVNIPVVLAWMVPHYLQSVLPGLPGELARAYYWLPSVMLVAGALAEGLGVYILLVAGTTWLPERWRFRRYKRWMRAELLLWWLVVTTGVFTYYVWYVAG